MLAPVSTPGADLIVPREIVRATGRLAGSQVFVSATLPLNATVGAVAAKNLSGHEGLAGTSVGIAFLFSMLSLYVVGSIAQNLGRKPVLLAGLSLLGARRADLRPRDLGRELRALRDRHRDLRLRPGARRCSGAPPRPTSTRRCCAGAASARSRRRARSARSSGR